MRISAIYLILRVYEMISRNFDGTVPYRSLVRSPQFFTNCKIIFFYPRVTDQSLRYFHALSYFPEYLMEFLILIILQTNRNKSVKFKQGSFQGFIGTLFSLVDVDVFLIWMNNFWFACFCSHHQSCSSLVNQAVRRPNSPST